MLCEFSDCFLLLSNVGLFAMLYKELMQLNHDVTFLQQPLPPLFVHRHCTTTTLPAQ